MDTLLYVAAAVLFGILLILLVLLKKQSQPVWTPDLNDGDDRRGIDAGRPRGEVAVAGGRRVRGARRRMAAARMDDSEEEEEIDPDIDLPEGKIGAKKMAKLQAKAEKRKMREAELQEREERKKREEMREAQRKKEEKRREAEEKLKEEEAQRLKEEQEQREYEEYLKLKEEFEVEEEGTHEAELEQDVESLLQEFIDYIKQMKVVMLEDLAAHFKLKTQEAIERIQTLQEEGQLTGVIDDRGKFIYITEEEYQAVAKFIRQRGRVSIVELAESSNKLINLNPDNNKTMQQKLLSDSKTGQGNVELVSA